MQSENKKELGNILFIYMAIIAMFGLLGYLAWIWLFAELFASVGW